MRFYCDLSTWLPVNSGTNLSGDFRDGIKPCEMKKRRLLFATKVAGGSYMCEGGRKEKGGKGQYVPSRKTSV